MGTNYYHISKDAEKTHIGKSSCGWCFGLHVYPETEGGPLDFSDWVQKLSDGWIVDEYGAEISFKEMIECIAGRSHHIDWTEKHDWNKSLWYKNEADFHKKNYSLRGPKNLIRHQILENHCIGHGDGTWDYLVGEFS